MGGVSYLTYMEFGHWQRHSKVTLLWSGGCIGYDIGTVWQDPSQVPEGCADLRWAWMEVSPTCLQELVAQAQKQPGEECLA